MADALDVITLAEGKAALNIDMDDAGADIELGAYITAASRRLDSFCGPIVERAVTDILDGGTITRASIVRLSEFPVASITTVTEYANGVSQVLTAETNGAATSTDYLFDPAVGRLYRRSSRTAYQFPAGLQNIVVIYQAGRFPNTAAVDPIFKMGAQLMLRDLWSAKVSSEDMLSARDGASPFGRQPTFGLPNSVQRLLAGERRAPHVA